jgi:hypothetical protein
MSQTRSKKFFIIAKDERFPDNIQFNILTILNADDKLLVNQYGKLFGVNNLGEFDIEKEENLAVLLFFPIDERVNDYTYAFVSFGFLVNADENVSSIDLGDLVKITSNRKETNIFSKIIEIPLTYYSSKIDIQLTVGNTYQFDEISIVHNNDTLSFTNFGTIFSGISSDESVGIGTYFPYIENDRIYVDFIPNLPANNEFIFNSSITAISDINSIVAGERTLRNIVLLSRKTIIEKSIDPLTGDPDPLFVPQPVEVGSHGLEYDASYYLAQCVDLDTNRVQVSEIVIINDRTQTYLIEFAKISTDGEIGTFSTLKPFTSQLLFTPNDNSNIEVTIYQKKISSIVDLFGSDTIDLENFEIVSGISRAGVDGDFVTDFNLTHKGIPIFERLFNGSNPEIVNLNNNTILIPEHFFVTGEKVEYISNEFDLDDNQRSIKIEETTVPGIGVTNILPRDVYAVKVDDRFIKLSKTAEDALKILPETYNFTDLGVGNIHKIISTKQNAKSLISIDNIIQNPIIPSDTTTVINSDISLETFTINIENQTIVPIDTIIKINDEMMRVVGVSDNLIVVRRNILGTIRQEHPQGSIVRVMNGNYNIVNSRIYFRSAPYGNLPEILPTDPVDERDYSGLEVSSTFDGRVFIRSGVTLSDIDTYNKNYLFDDISDNFDGVTKEFEIKSDFEDVSGISEDNAVLLINSIYQSPEPTNVGLSNVSGAYKFIEDSEKTKIVFSGSGVVNPSDINTSSIPYGGVIVSVGSTFGFGYQPLVSAGGTATVNSSGEISNISIGNSGSGYRVGIQTQINVGVKTFSSGTPNIEIIGIASVSNGNIVNVNITNPGTGYTFTSPPEVVFDYPIGYINIPLIYSSESQPGIGTQASVDVVVGSDGKIIAFNMSNYGYGYELGDILTIPTYGPVGIPTLITPNFEEFQIFVDKVFTTSFSGWSMGQFEVLDNLNSKFNGRNKNFQISLEGNPISIAKRKGSPIEIEYVLLVFVNDILQIPYKDYTFSGSIIRFNSAPNGPIDNPPYSGDTSKIIFYKGTRDIDVEFVEILDAPKAGDRLQIRGNTKNTSQKSRIIEFVSTIDIADTNNYADIGVTSNENLLRPVKWCKQDKDLYIFNKPVTKDRRIYNPYINPVSYLTKNVTSNDVEIFVDSVKLFFDYNKENISSKKLNVIEIISNNENEGEYELITEISGFDGDFGNIVGIGSTFISENPCLVFDLYIPTDSYLKNIDINPNLSSDGVSGIETGYRFVVSGTNSGNTNSSFDINGELVGMSTFFIDNIYECIHFSNEISFLAGIGFTNVTKVTTAVNHFDGIEFVNPLGFIEDFNFVGGTEITVRSNEIYSNVSSSGGSGINATFNIERDNVGKVSNVFVNNGGVGYNIGDILTIPGDSIGGGGSIDSFNFVGSTVDFGDTYIGIGGTTSGSGVGAVFDIVRNNFGEIESVTISNKGSNYIENDTITILGSNVGGIDTDDDIIITVENIEIKTIDSIMSGIGSEGSYIGVGGTTSGSGVGAEFDIVIDEFGQLDSIQISNPGLNYQINDTVTILSDSIGAGGNIDSFNFVGSTIDFGDTYIGIGGTTSGSGFDALFDIVRDNFGEIESVTISNKGSNYIENDTITILGSNVGGDDTTDDVIITVENIEIKTIDSIMSGIGSEGLYIGVAGTTSGSGINAEFDIVIDEFGQLDSIQISNPGLNYQINDTVTISGDSIGGGGSIGIVSFTATAVGTAATYTGVTGTTSGDGVGAEFEVERGSFGEIINIDIVEPGRRYDVGDTITILGSDVGGGGSIGIVSFTATAVGTAATYTGVTGTTSGDGVGAEFNIERDELGVIIDISVVESGIRYDVGDTITILGSDVGGTDTTDDVIITVTEIVDNDQIIITVTEIADNDQIIITITSTQINSVNFVASILDFSATYTGVDWNYIWNGVGAEFEVERGSFGEIINIDISKSGIKYDVADTITILGSDVGGIDVVDDVTITVIGIADNDQIIITITSTQINSVNFVASILDFSATYTGIGGTTSGSGIGAEFEVERGSFGEIISLSILNIGFSYSINDTIRILGFNVGGVSGDDDIVVTITDVVDNDFILLNIDEISVPDTFIFGKYSWGKIDVPFRSKFKEFNIITPAIAGISTNPIVRRKNRLRDKLNLLSPIYSVTSTSNNLFGGDRVTFTITAINVDSETQLFYTISGNISESDFVENSLSGSFLVIDFGDGIPIASVETNVISNLSPGENSNFILQIRTGSIFGQIVSVSEIITINR